MINLKLRQRLKDQAESDRLVIAWEKIHQDQDAYLTARDGDHLMAPFECDNCIFHKLKFREANPANHSDNLLLATIHRANLDVFWSTAPGTVGENTRRLKIAMGFSKRLGLTGPYLQQGPYPQFDYCGYEAACQILIYSLNKGRIDPNHTQWNTVKQLRTVYTNQIRISSQANREIISMNDSAGHYQRFNTDPFGSIWFQKFVLGCHSRMGDQTNTNKAMSTVLLRALFRKIENKISEASSGQDRHKWSIFAAYAAVCYVISLRGNEGFLLDLAGIIKH